MADYRDQVKIYLRQEQLGLNTTFQKGLGAENRNLPSKYWPLTQVDKRSDFSKLKYFSGLLSANLHWQNWVLKKIKD